MLPNNIEKSKVLRDQLTSITYNRTSTNNLSLSASGDNRDDYADALALCVSVIPDTVGDNTSTGPRGGDAIVSLDDVANQSDTEDDDTESNASNPRNKSRVASGGSRRRSMSNRDERSQNGRGKARRVRDRNRRR
jgi:hypothetical protein